MIQKSGFRAVQCLSKALCSYLRSHLRSLGIEQLLAQPLLRLRERSKYSEYSESVTEGVSLCRRETEPEDGLEQLLGPEGRDVEQGEQKRERSWYSLIGTALKHVWPHHLGMQTRVLICLVIVIAQRLVNLAVPILCEASNSSAVLVA